jgi:hypothetical protein
MLLRTVATCCCCLALGSYVLGQYGPISEEFVTKNAYEEYTTPTALGRSIHLSCGKCI